MNYSLRKEKLESIQNVSIGLQKIGRNEENVEKKIYSQAYQYFKSTKCSFQFLRDLLRFSAIFGNFRPVFYFLFSRIRSQRMFLAESDQITNGFFHDDFSNIIRFNERETKPDTQ
ncbi:hypothetical protein SSS_00291 [Sarcoptes scabiei]|nr:hypothetical protein SSS_00291 [Sarcoptes scabiei]